MRSCVNTKTHLRNIGMCACRDLGNSFDIRRWVAGIDRDMVAYRNRDIVNLHLFNASKVSKTALSFKGNAFSTFRFFRSKYPPIFRDNKPVSYRASQKLYVHRPFSRRTFGLKPSGGQVLCFHNRKDNLKAFSKQRLRFPPCYM